MILSVEYRKAHCINRSEVKVIHTRCILITFYNISVAATKFSLIMFHLSLLAYISLLAGFYPDSVLYICVIDSAKKYLAHTLYNFQYE